MIDNIVRVAVSQLRGYFRNIYIGGSYAANKIAFPLLPYNDIDIFILAPRDIEDWAMQNILLSIFDTVAANAKGTAEYKIKYQYKRYKCTKDGIKFDIILLNTDFNGLLESTASDLSKLYLEVSYGEKMLYPCTDEDTCKTICNLLLKKLCIVYVDQCTKDHLHKIFDRCNLLGLDLIKKENNIQTPRSGKGKHDDPDYAR